MKLECMGRITNISVFITEASLSKWALSLFKFAYNVDAMDYKIIRFNKDHMHTFHAEAGASPFQKNGL
jgi:hypothetical protein